jgi:hypothetical protein
MRGEKEKNGISLTDYKEQRLHNYTDIAYVFQLKFSATFPWK